MAYFSFISISLGVVAIILGRRLWHLWQIDRLRRSLTTPNELIVFTPDLVANLPPPVQRYLLHAIAPGTPLANAVQIDMQGSFKTNLNQPWLPLKARQWMTALSGFVWQATIGKPRLQFIGADSYCNHQGRVHFDLWGAIPLVDQHSDEISRSSLGRLAIEMVWLPSALLPHNGVTWHAHDEYHICAEWTMDGEPISLQLTIDNQGRLQHAELSRWNEQIHGYSRFGSSFVSERTFNGITIPTQVAAGWNVDSSDYHEFFRAVVRDAKFSTAV